MNNDSDSLALLVVYYQIAHCDLNTELSLKYILIGIFFELLLMQYFLLCGWRGNPMLCSTLCNWKKIHLNKKRKNCYWHNKHKLQHIIYGQFSKMEYVMLLLQFS